MITNKDIRVENGSLIINGDPYPLDGHSPEAIMQIVEDNSDTTPTEDSTAPITSGGVFAADKAISDTIGDITQTGVTGADVASQIAELGDKTVKTSISPTLSSNIAMDHGVITVCDGVCYFAPNFYSSDEVTIGTVVTVGQLPNNCIPKVSLKIPCINETADILGVLIISYQGAITYYPKISNRFFGYVNSCFEVN